MGHRPLPRLRTPRHLRPLRSPLHPLPQHPHRHSLARRNPRTRLNSPRVPLDEQIQLQRLRLNPPNPHLRHRPLRYRSPADPRRRRGSRAELERYVGVYQGDVPEVEVFDYGLYGVDGCC
jgi:hypothetical protein